MFERCTGALAQRQMPLRLGVSVLSWVLPSLRHSPPRQAIRHSCILCASACACQRSPEKPVPALFGSVVPSSQRSDKRGRALLILAEDALKVVAELREKGI